MKVYVHENSKIVEVLLTNAEKNDPAVQEKLKPIYAEYEGKKYTVAVFLSGEKDLCEETSELLLSNRRRMAEREVRAERQSGMIMGM